MSDGRLISIILSPEFPSDNIALTVNYFDVLLQVCRRSELKLNRPSRLERRCECPAIMDCRTIGTMKRASTVLFGTLLLAKLTIVSTLDCGAIPD